MNECLVCGKEKHRKNKYYCSVECSNAGRSTGKNCGTVCVVGENDLILHNKIYFNSQSELRGIMERFSKVKYLIVNFVKSGRL